MPIRHEPWLVLASIGVAILASYVALSLVSRVSVARSRKASMLWLGGGAMSMGIGIWSMHFVGMLAAVLPIPIVFDMAWTLLSLAIAIVISGFALFYVNRGATLGWARLAIGGGVMGTGIASMHYTGMTAIEVRPPIVYEPLLFAFSVVIAMVASCAALWLFFNFRSASLERGTWSKRGASAVVMGAAIVGMHYTGMAAATFAPHSVSTAAPGSIDNTWLGTAVVGFTVLFLMVTLLIAMVDSHLVDRSARHAEKLTEMNERLRNANRAKGEFLATMSHEIRTPMNGVFGMLELLSMSKLDVEQRATLDVVRGSCQSLLRIIDDILDFSKIEAGKLDVRPEATSLKRIIDDVHRLYSGNASSKGLILQSSIDPRISPAVLVDPHRLRQILNNLVGNSIKFTSQGCIEIRAALLARADGVEQVCISVHDTGVGIPEDSQATLFQPFSQGDIDTARQFGGTGLGLTICRQLAQMMGGSVEMQSRVGVGTTVKVTLPLPPVPLEQLPEVIALDSPKPPAPVAPRRAPPGVAQAEAEGTLALVVDDHPINRMLLLRQVQTLGYAAETAEDGVHALELWESGRFGIVITDCNMPNMDGLELARSIRRLERSRGGRRVPVIACTANAIRGEAEKCFEAGMDDYLIKPMDLRQLCDKLDQWLPLPRDDGALDVASLARQGRQLGHPDELVDVALVCETFGIEPSDIGSILAALRDSNEGDAGLLRQAVAERDLDGVILASHRMLGASKMVGANAFSEVCRSLEKAARAGDWSTITNAMPAFDAQWSRLKAYLEAFGSRTSTP